MLDSKYMPVVNFKSREEIKGWFSKNFNRLAVGGIDHLGHEPNSSPEEFFEKSDLKVLVVRLSAYQAVDVSMSHSLVGQMMREVPGVFIDFCFMPLAKDYDIFLKEGIPVMFGNTTKAWATDFDIIAVSHAFSNERLNLPGLLKNSGIYMFKNQRFQYPMGKGGQPLIMMGGANSTAVEDLHGYFDEENYGIIDCAVIGEAEEVLPKITARIKEGKVKGESKQEIMKGLHEMKLWGFYEPDKYDHIYKDGALAEIKPNVDWVPAKVRRAIVPVLDNVRTLEEGILHYSGGMGRVVDIQIAAGCGGFNSCTFCRESWEAGSYRERSVEKVAEAALKARVLQGAPEVNFFSLNWSYHTRIYDLIKFVYSRFGEVNLISQKADIIAASDHLAEVEHEVGKRNVTIGVEGISTRLRNFLNKTLSEEQFVNSVRKLIDAGMAEIKLFFIATHLENDDDVSEFVRVMDSFEQYKKETGATTHLRVSFTPFFASPNTPLQFSEAYTATMHGQRNLERLIDFCGEAGVGFRTSCKNSDSWISQLLLMADRRLTPLIVRSSIDDNYRYYGLMKQDMMDIWQARMAEMGLNEDYYFKEKDMNYVFAWDFLDFGWKKEMLWNSYLKAKAFIGQDYCLNSDASKGHCYACGACATKENIKFMVKRKIQKAPEREEFKKARRPLHGYSVARFLVNIDRPEVSPVEREFMYSAVARAFMMVDPEKHSNLFVNFKGHSRSAPGANQQRDWVTGKIIMDLALSDFANEEEFKSYIPKINENLWGFHVEDIRVLREPQPIRNECRYALYNAKVPTTFGSFYDLQMALDDYFRKKEVKIKVKVVAGKKMYKTEMQSLDKTLVKTVSIKFTGSGDNEITFVADSTLNPYALLEALLGVKSYKFLANPVHCLGYFKDSATASGEVDLWSMLSGGQTAVCSSCSSAVEINVFDGSKPIFSSNQHAELCLACAIL